MTDDQRIRDRISELVELEHSLERGHPGRPLTDDERAQLENAQVELDRTWDLLRARNARREAGENPDEAHTRDASVVEGYQQ